MLLSKIWEKERKKERKKLKYVLLGKSGEKERKKEKRKKETQIRVTKENWGKGKKRKMTKIKEIKENIFFKLK